VNGENAADGVGITAKLADKILAAGADVITLGNHVWRQKDIIPVLERKGPVIRPENLGGPGRGLTVQPAADGTPVAVVNLQGALFLSPPRSPFLIVDDLVEEARREAKIVIVDFHAEATSEKVALARMLDGRVTAVLGTHTHVQTADERILPKGTACLTDVGMTGPHESIIGVTVEAALSRFINGMPAKFESATGPGRLNAVIVTADPGSGKATAIERLNLSAQEVDALPAMSATPR